MSSIRYRILFSFILTMFVMVTIIGIGHYFNVEWLMTGCFEEGSRTFASQISRQAVSPLYSEDIDQLELMASQSRLISSLKSITFFNQEGKLVFSTIPKAEIESVLEVNPSSSYLTRHHDGIVIREPIFLTNFDVVTLAPTPARPIGEVLLGFSNADLTHHLASIRNTLILVEAFLAILSGLLMFLLERWVTKPLVTLISEVQNLAKGDLSVRVEVPRSAGEITSLCSAVNLMADSLELERLNLECLNQELEKRVCERTTQLEAANKELEAFSYSVSHDLRAPLRGIDGWSLALLEDCQHNLGAKGNQHLARVRSEAQRMGQLIDGMLQLSRVTLSQIQFETVDLTGLAKNIAARLSESLPDRRIEFSIQPGLSAYGDAMLLEIVLTNLLDNACKFTGLRDLAQIELGRTEEGECPAFFVRDNGVGFDMAYSEKLFGAFQRLHKASEFPGTGIGLATVARIIHRHGGRVWCNSLPKKATTFFFSLPDKIA